LIILGQLITDRLAVVIKLTLTADRENTIHKLYSKTLWLLVLKEGIEKRPFWHELHPTSQSPSAKFWEHGRGNAQNNPIRFTEVLVEQLPSLVEFSSSQL